MKIKDKDIKYRKRYRQQREKVDNGIHKQKIYKFENLERFKTDDELLIYKLFKSRGLNPIWQYQIGRYIADFVFKKEKVVIEIDGGIHNRPECKLRDKIKSIAYKSEGWLVVNIDYNNIEDDWEEIKIKILKICGWMKYF